MAINVKPVNVTVQKYQTNASIAGPAYTAGINNPKQDWATSTENAATTWGAAVSQAVTNGTFAKGVAAAGTAKWQANSLQKGAARYAPGISAGLPTYTRKITNVLQVIAGVNLPPKGPTGSPNNVSRVSAVDAALVAAKAAGQFK